jgi:peptidyl-prolyl cis-trans isomerase SurA
MSQKTDRRVWTSFGLIACFALTSACGQASTSTTPAAGPDVWATVDGREIRKDAVEKAFRASADPNAIVSDDEVLGAKLNLVDELINQDLLQQRAVAEKLEATGTEIENAFAERKRNVPDATFNLELSQRGLTAEDARLSIGKELAIRKLLDRDITQKITIPDSEIAAFFEKNKAQFNLAEPQYRLGQIGVTPVKDPSLRNRQNSDAGSPAEAKTKVDMIMNRIKEGVDFGELALDFSEDPSSLSQGGDLGFVAASQLRRVSPSLLDAVTKMQPGGVSMVSMNGSYTILLLIAREPAGQKDLSNPSVRDGIRDLLRSRKEEMLRAAYITNLRNNAVVVNHLARQIIDQQAKVAAPPAAAPAAPGAATK